MNTIEYINYMLSDEELLCQLAEEASELAQAALKLRRAMTGDNPTPVTIEQARKNLIEELADVRLVAEVLNMGTRVKNEIDGVAAHKMERWAKRLGGVE